MLYRLEAVVSHIGEQATSGHYVAYRPRSGGFTRLDDSTALPVSYNPGDVWATEKVYVVCYARVTAAVPALVQPAIDLEEQSEDSDVIVSTDAPPLTATDTTAKTGGNQKRHERTSKTRSQGPMKRIKTEQQQDTTQKLGNFANYSDPERDFIVTALQTSKSFADALVAIRKKIEHFTLSQKDSQYRLNRNTLMNWFRRPELADRAQRLIGAIGTSPPTFAFTRKPSWRSCLGAMPPQQQQEVVQAMTSGTPSPILSSIVQEQAPANDTKVAVPRTTLRRWRQVQRSNEIANGPSAGSDAAAPSSTDGIHTTWVEEYDFNFSVTAEVPPRRKTSSPDEDPSAVWLLEGSWTFCPLCGRRRPRTKTQKWLIHDLRHYAVCRPACDNSAQALLAPAPADALTTRVVVYTTPHGSTWHTWSAAIDQGALPLSRILTPEDLKELAVLTVHVDYRSRRGGHAEITSKQKRSVSRCRWQPRPLRRLRRGDLAARAFTWLLQNNDTYRAWVDRHAALFLENGELDQANRELQTAELLLGSPGIEVAIRPWLYPLASLADTDYHQRLPSLGWMTSKNKPSIRTGFMRKLESRCLDYSADFPLQCLIYDTCMAKTITSVQALADKQKVSPEQIASDMDSFDVYWQQQLRKMEDICRQEHEKHGSLDKALPSVFFTIAPAEWRYLLHNGMFHEGPLADQQQNITMHLYHTLQVLLEHHLLKNGESLAEVGIAKVRQWSYRFEFQSRGTLHLHAVLWADLLPGRSAGSLAGRTGTPHASAFVALLERLFRSRVDVQCGDGSHNLLQYVAGYVSKASDALSFSHRQAQQQGTSEEQSKWRQSYRLLCKKSPMEQEITMEFAGLPMVKHSFSGHALFAPIPGSKTRNTSRDQYLLYQYYLRQPVQELGCAKGFSFMQWIREFRIVDVEKRLISKRNLAGPMKNADCGIAMTFPFELLDIFIGAWAATFLPDVLEHRLYPDVDEDDKWYPPELQNEKSRRASFTAPDGFKHLKAVLCLDRFQLYRADPAQFRPNVGDLLALVETDLILRGLTADRISTFKARIHASTLLLCAFRDGREDPTFWTARSVSAPPARLWSREQQLVLDHIKTGTSVSNAADMEETVRVLQVAGGPGTGKTEVIIAAVRQALDDDCRVLIAGPIGLLVSMYRLRLPNMQNLTMETVHSAFRITRDADAAYVPPGRLRQYDLIVIDEVSQIEASVWRKLRTALGELRPCPFLVLVGDFQQLQPLQGGPELETALRRQRQEDHILYVKLEHHEAARSVDPDMLQFLEAARVDQPSRRALRAFFEGRILPRDLALATRAAVDIETQTNQKFTFLTVTNKGAADLNVARLGLQFPDAASLLRSGGGIPADKDRIALGSGMRLRLTHNIDKERGFVNGNTGVVRSMLRADVFILQSDQGTPILIHPVTQQGRKFLPVTYGWATTIRRAQGATLEKVGLFFDRKLPDRGYGYVGLSRAKRMLDVFLVHKIRRTDWRAVGGEGQAAEQTQLSALSESTHSSEASDADISMSDESPSTAEFNSSDSEGDPDFSSESYPEPSSSMDFGFERSSSS